MSANSLGPKKVRALARKTGLDITGVLVWSHYDNGREADAVVRTKDGHVHYTIDRVTGEYELNPSPTHWSTCETPP